MSFISRIRSWFPESSSHLQKKIIQAEKEKNPELLKEYLVRYCHLTAYEIEDVSFLIKWLNHFVITYRDDPLITDAIPDILDFLHRFDIEHFNTNGRSLFLITELYSIYHMCRYHMYNDDYDGFLSFYDEQRDAVIKKGLHYFGREFLMLDINNRKDLLIDIDNYREEVQLSWGQLGVEARLLEDLEITIEGFHHFVQHQKLQFFDEFDVLDALDYTMYMLWCHGRAVLSESQEMANQYFDRAEATLKKVDWLLNQNPDYEFSEESRYLLYVIRHYRAPNLINKEELVVLWKALDPEEQEGMRATLETYKTDVERTLLNILKADDEQSVLNMI